MNKELKTISEDSQEGMLKGELRIGNIPYEYVGVEGLNKINDRDIQAIRKVWVGFDSGHSWEMEEDFNCWYVDDYTKQTPKSVLNEFITELMPKWFRLDEPMELEFYGENDKGLPLVSVKYWPK